MHSNVQNKATPTPRVLITGATGFLGRRVLAALANYDVEILACARHATSLAGHTAHSVDFAEHTEQSLTTLLSQFACTHLLHLAWDVGPGFYTAPSNFNWVHYSEMLTRAFIRAGGLAIVAAGTCAEYDPNAASPWHENAAIAPTTLYGSSKVATHTSMAQLCLDAGVRLAWGRIGFLYGPHERAEKFISLMATKLQARQPIEIRELHKRVDYVHVDDAAAAFVRLVLHPQADGAFNIGSGQPTALHELLSMIASTLQRDNPVASRDSLSAAADSQTQHVVLDISRLRELGWQPIVPLKVGVAETIAAGHASGSVS